MRIALDIDSTLHHYWDCLSAAARRRFGIDLPYEEQFDYGVTRLRPDQLEVVIAETHCDKTILAGTPYPGAVETVRAWHEQGHYIHVTSHRAQGCHEATARWLAQIGVPFDDLCCTYEKVNRCLELDIDLLVDDSPSNLLAALDHGIRVATIEHPWNQELCETEDILSARDWLELGRLLEPLLSDRRVA
jgi:uncharacterized HAD superfamily protein